MACGFGEQRENARSTAQLVDSVDGVHRRRTRQCSSRTLPGALRHVGAVCGRPLRDPDRAVRVRRLFRGDARLHADGCHRQRWFAAQVHRVGHHAGRLQLRLLQQRREEISQTQQGPLHRGELAVSRGVDPGV